MKVLCDVHIPYKLVNFLNVKNIEAVHINQILDQWYTKDSDICQYADSNDYVVVSKDADFSNSHLLKSTPRKLIRINLGNIKNNQLIQIFNANLELFLEKFTSSKCYIEINRQQITVTTSD